jgi:hypothetical protein
LLWRTSSSTILHQEWTQIKSELSCSALFILAGFCQQIMNVGKGF